MERKISLYHAAYCRRSGFLFSLLVAFGSIAMVAADEVDNEFTLPDQCNSVIKKHPVSKDEEVDYIDQYVPYQKAEWVRYIVIAFLIFVYTLPILYVYSKRNFVETRARSPITTSLCIFFIMLDSIFNTWIFSIDTDSVESAQLKCLLGVWVTMMLMIPILLSMYIRIYRVKRVFELYEKFLDRLTVRSNSVFSTLGVNSNTSAPRQNNTIVA